MKGKVDRLERDMKLVLVVLTTTSSLLTTVLVSFIIAIITGRVALMVR